MLAAEQQRPDVAVARRRWRAAQRYTDPRRLVFVDETGTATNMARRFGCAPVGHRLIGRVPHGHWKTTTFVARLRRDGIVAPLVLDGPMNGPGFRAHVEQFIAPALRGGDIVVMDNLACHKVAGVPEAINRRDAQIFYLPPFSPALNPIELAFAKLKALLRSAGERTVDALWDRIGEPIDRFQPTE